MQPLSDTQLALNIFAAVVLPLLVFANVSGWSGRTPFNVYLWRESPGFMWASMAVLVLLALDALVTLGVHFGILAPSTGEYWTPMFGIPFMIAAVAVIAFGIMALVRFLRSRRDTA